MIRFLGHIWLLIPLTAFCAFGVAPPTQPMKILAAEKGPASGFVVGSHLYTCRVYKRSTINAWATDLNSLIPPDLCRFPLERSKVAKPELVPLCRGVDEGSWLRWHISQGCILGMGELVHGHIAYFMVPLRYLSPSKRYPEDSSLAGSIGPIERIGFQLVPNLGMGIPRERAKDCYCDVMLAPKDKLYALCYLNGEMLVWRTTVPISSKRYLSQTEEGDFHWEGEKPAPGNNFDYPPLFRLKTDLHEQFLTHADATHFYFVTISGQVHCCPKTGKGARTKAVWNNPQRPVRLLLTDDVTGKTFAFAYRHGLPTKAAPDVSFVLSEKPVVFPCQRFVGPQASTKNSEAALLAAARLLLKQKKIGQAAVATRPGSALTPQPEPERPGRPSAATIRAFKNLNAEYGVFQRGTHGRAKFLARDENPLAQGEPGFQISDCEDETLAQLPKVRLPFGLSLEYSGRFSDESLKHLANLPRLRYLDLSHTVVTDSGLKYLAPLKELRYLDISRTKITGTGLKGLDRLDHLESLNLDRTDLTNGGLQQIGAWKHLLELRYSFTQVSDAGLKNLDELEHLRSLHLDSTKISNAGLKQIARLKELRLLSFNNTDVGNEGMKHLAALKQLRHLSLVNTSCGDMGLQSLAGLVELRSLDLRGTDISDTGMKYLAGLNRLRDLCFSATRVGDAGLERLAGLKRIRHLTIWNTQVSDAGLKCLSGFQRLQTLDLNGTRVTDDGIARLRKALPKCEILH